MASKICAYFPIAALLTVGFGSLFNGQSVVVEEPVAITAWLIGAVPASILLLCAMPWAASRRALWRSSRSIVLGFAGLLLWAAIRAVGVVRCLNMRDGEVIGVCFPDWVAWVPLLQAGVTMLLAWLCVAFIPVQKRDWWISALALAVVALTAIALLRALIHPRGFNRLGSGLGGAAVLPVALIIAVAGLIGAYLAARRIVLLLAASLGVVLLLLTFSRAGIALGVGTAVILLWQGRRQLVRLNRHVLIAGLAIGVIASIGLLISFPTLAARLLTLGDSGRAENLATALNVWLANPVTFLIGAGSAGVWPWYGVDANLVWAPETGMVGVSGIEGQLLVNPHSTVLGVAVEYGVVGLLLLGAVLFFVARAALATKLSSATSYALYAAAIVMAGFLFDTYLIRNPGVSFVWWFAVFIGSLGTSGLSRREHDGSLGQTTN